MAKTAQIRYNDAMSKTRISLTSLRNQFIGAAVGTGVALGVYGLYTAASPMIASVFPSQTVEASTSKFSDADRAARVEEIGKKAKGILEREGVR